MKWYGSALVAFIATCSPASSATISTIGEVDGVEFITVEGKISRGDDVAFRIEALKHATAVVILESPGGSLLAGLSIGRLIRERQFATAVMNSHCESACALIWMGGVKRFVSNRAKIGFHAAYDPGEAVSGSGNALIGAYLSRLGYPDKVIEFATDAKPDDMDYLTASRAAELGVSYTNLDELPSKNKKAPPPEKPFERPAQVAQLPVLPTPSPPSGTVYAYPPPARTQHYDGPKFKDYQTPPAIQLLLPTPQNPRSAFGRRGRAWLIAVFSPVLCHTWARSRCRAAR
jgi:hypothetical protein